MILLMESNPHFFLGLAGAALARTSIRKSLLMAAKSFRVGTFSSIRFLAFSTRGTSNEPN